MTSTIAYNRFGLGMRADDPLLRDPKAWLLAQVNTTAALPPVLRGQQPTTEALLGTTRALIMERRTRKQAMAPAEAQPAGPQPAGNGLGRYYVGQVSQRLTAAVQTDTPFAERLVHFWANHFAVSADKGRVRAIAGTYENEAIRPHVNGRFADLLLSVVRHPAMIMYLDNGQSIGPNSLIGQRRSGRGPRKAGLNENLARELLELHTLGVRSVYSQADVTEMARALTGWAVADEARDKRLDGTAGAHGFMFYGVTHEPGARTLLGKRYAEGGQSQAVAMIRDLAAHPATAKFVATKLARHFIADEPPAPAVAVLEKAFLDSEGDLPVVYRALVALPDAWVTTARKFKSPWEFAVSAMRLLDIAKFDPNRAFGMLRAMGQPPMAPPSPAGWPDSASRWISSDSIGKRLSFAAALSARVPASFDARAMADRLFGTGLTQTTQTELARAESGVQALTLLLTSPEFMRR